MRQVSLLLLLGLTAFAARGQYTSRLGRFQVDQIRGCAPFTVNILTTSFPGNPGCTGGTPCLMSFDGSNNCPPNASCQNITQFTYTQPGTYKLSVLYQSIGSDDITITVDPNVAPAFEMFTCAGSKVQVDITDNTYDSYSIDFNNDGVVDAVIPSGLTQTANFNYGTPGNYAISVKGKKINAANNCNANVQSFAAVPILPTPVINTLTAVDGATLTLNFAPQTNVAYQANIAFNNNANFQQYKSLFGTNTLTIPNLTLASNFYCLELGAHDPCANTNTYAVPVCSHAFSLTFASGVNHLAWKTSAAGIANIRVVRQDPTSQSFTALPGTTTAYDDQAIICQTKYCYQLVSHYASGATSTSLQNCGTSFLIDQPTAVDNTSAVVSHGNAQVDLVWQQDPAYVATLYQVLRNANAGGYVPLATSTTTAYSDATYSEGYCYRVNYTDQCANASTGGLPSCPILLRGSADDMNNGVLSWSGYRGWALGVKNYTVQKFNTQGQLLQTFNAGTDTTFTDAAVDFTNQVVYYSVVAAANAAGIPSSVSNEIKIVRKVNLFYPTAFNPDSKVAPVNRTFTVKGHFIAKLVLQIFDRWGTLIFTTDQNEAWDGRQNGVNMPVDTYVWTAEGTDLIGNAFKKSGTVLLIRN